MESSRATRSWGTAALILAAVVCVAAAALSVTTVARAQTGQAGCPSVIIQWQPQSVLETMFRARILEDNKAIMNGLRILADHPETTADQMKRLVGHTYLKTPHLWVNGKWIDDWPDVLDALKGILHKDSQIAINSVSAVIEYQTYDQVLKPGAAADIDARVTVTMTFSASPGDNILKGELKHSRVCEII
jgi:hypothetical protein